MACFVPFNSRNLEVSFLVFRPTVVFVEELVDVLKNFSSYTETLGCLHASIFKSIHGNMIIWYGAWMKNKCNHQKDAVMAALLSMNVFTMATLIDHTYFDAYGGESRNGSPAATFSTGDTISMTATYLANDEITEKDFSYACLAIFKSRIVKMDGVEAGVCLKSKETNAILGLYIWKSLQSCYTWILNSDCKNTIPPYFHVKYDIFKVIYVSGDNVQSFQYYPHLMIENEVRSKQGCDMIDNVQS